MSELAINIYAYQGHISIYSGESGVFLVLVIYSINAQRVGLKPHHVDYIMLIFWKKTGIYNTVSHY